MAGNWFGDWRPYWSRPEPVPEETTAMHGAWEPWEDTDAVNKANEEEKKNNPGRAKKHQGRTNRI